MRLFAIVLLLTLNSAAADGACTNDADHTVWESKGKAAFEKDMSDCGHKAMGSSSTAATCMTGKEGYSNGCANCFGDSIHCSAQNCWSKCIGGETASCKTCIEQFCVPALKTCTGITDFPPADGLHVAAVAPANDGACTNDADHTVWESKGKLAFEKDMSDCGHKAMGSSSTATTCMTGKEGYSNGCAKCFGDNIHCGAQHCLSKCMFGETASCKTCIEQFCVPALKTCTGITDFPPADGLHVAIPINEGTAITMV